MIYSRHNYTRFSEIVALLLQDGADPNGKSDRGTTPLHEAAKMGKLETVVLLLENKADVNNKDNDNKSPLYYAIANGHQKVVMRLLENGAEINSAAKDGTTPLHLAAVKGSIPLLTLLIEKGAKVDARDLKGNTALACIPLAERPVPENPSPSHRLAADIKLLFSRANGKKQYDDDEPPNGYFSDVTFNVEGSAVNAHRNIVSLRCPRLGKLFKKNAAHDDVNINDISLPIFQAILEWIYSDEVVLLRSADPNVSTILALFFASDRYVQNFYTVKVLY